MERSASQPALLDAPAPSAVRLPAGATEELPIAQVLLDSPVPHLDRPFDYAVPMDLSETVVPGGRVKVRFSGREFSAWVLARRQEASTGARLSMITKVVSALPVLSAEVIELAGQVARRCGGVTSDVLRAAVPRRAARVELEFGPEDFARPGITGERALEPQRTAHLALKSYGPAAWPQQVVSAVRRTVGESPVPGQGPGAAVVLPDQRDAEAALAALQAAFGADLVAQLTSDMGPTSRYRSYLRVRCGQARIVVGTRSAMFAPVADLGHIVMLDDDDPSHAEPRAPYHHARDVALLRAVQTGADVTFLSAHRSLEVQRLVERGWLAEEAPDRTERRAWSPQIIASADSYQQSRDPAAQRARMPEVAYRAARQGLERGPVLVQVGRSGFVPAVLCARCRSRQECPNCHGPLALPPHHGQSRTLRCRWCGLHHRDHRCAECGSTELRAAVRGAERTAQELGRAFPNIPVISSTGDQPAEPIGDRPAIVVSTPGVEPVAEEGYASALLLDGDAQLQREGLDVPRRVLARWFRAASLVRPRAEGGTVVVTAADEELTGALVRWDPVGFARRELHRRRDLGLPPAVRMLSLTGQRAEAGDFLAALSLPAGLDWVGPASTDNGELRWLLFFSFAQAEQVVGEVRRVRRTTSASAARSGQGRSLRIAVDDAESLQI